MSIAVAPIGRELLDDPDADPALVAESLGHIAQANRWLGGTAAARAGIAWVLRGRPEAGHYPASNHRSYTLLDIGTGAGDIPNALVRWGARRGITVRPFGLERHPAAAQLASRTLPTMVACAGAIPVRPRGVDLVLVSQVLHHLDRKDAITLLQNCARIARVGVVAADLERSALARTGFRLAARAFRFDASTRADGVTSIRRGYTPAELRELLAGAGVRGKVFRRPGWRLVACWRTEQQ